MLKTNFSIKGTEYDIVVLFAFSSNKCSGESVGCSHVLSIDVYDLDLTHIFTCICCLLITA